MRTPSLPDLVHEMIRALPDQHKVQLARYLDYSDGEKVTRLIEMAIYDYVDEDVVHDCTEGFVQT